VNNEGEVVGFYSIDGLHQHGFLFNDVTDTYQLLADPNVVNVELTQFLAINDEGQAVGYYQTDDGSRMPLREDLASPRSPASTIQAKSPASMWTPQPVSSVDSTRQQQRPNPQRCSCFQPASSPFLS